MNYHMYLPTRTLFGAGELNNLNIQEMPGRKAMIVISNGNSARANGALGRNGKNSCTSQGWRLRCSTGCRPTRSRTP